MTIGEGSERRLSGVVIAASTAIFAVLLIVLPSYFPTFDEAKYLGIGVDIWSGHGPTTVFGALFTSHAPAWPAIIALPQVLVGADPLTVGRFLDAIFGIAFVVLTGVLGWRVRPFVGAISTAGLLALVYLHDLTRTARLDVPAAALALVYLWVAFSAFRRGSIRFGIAAGLVFAIGFLIKEIDLPFAPAPLFAAILWGAPWRSLARTGAAMLGIAAAGVSPWFVYFASKSQHVYRLETPAWTLVPIALGLLVAITLGLSAGRIAESGSGRRIAGAASRLGPDGRLRVVVGWGFMLVWAILLTYVFARTSRLSGTSFLGLQQLQLYAATWFNALWIVAIFGLSGVALAIVALIVDPNLGAARGIRDYLIATICGIPLLLLVISVGEPPRNYLANLAILTILASAGWLWALERLLQSQRTILLIACAGLLGGTGGAVLARLASGQLIAFGFAGVLVGAGAVGFALGLERRGTAVRPLIVPAVVLAILVGGGGLLVAHGRNSQSRAGDIARGQAVRTEVAWIRANVPPGTKIAYGSFLAYETAYPLADQYRAIQVPARLSISSPTAPDGLLWGGEGPQSGWVAVDIAPRNVDQFEGFRGSWIRSAFLKSGATYWAYTTGIDTSSPTILAALSTATGFQEVASWTFSVSGTTPLQASIYRVDPSKISFDPTRLVFSPDALTRLVGLLAAHGASGRAAATRFSARVDVQPPGPAADAALAGLRALVGR